MGRQINQAEKKLTTVKKLNLSAYKQIMIIFPHPDDEVLTVGGLLYQASLMGKSTTLLITTKGERGTPDASEDAGLKKVRSNEASRVAKILGVGKLILADFGDGQLATKKPLLETYLTNQLSKIKPDLVITYDQSGLYGHPDHIALSEVVTKVVRRVKQKPTLLYAVLPQYMYAMAKLPTHMASDKTFLAKRKTANRSFFTGSGVIRKMQALYAYQSQLAGFRQSLPFRLPLTTYALTSMIEYFHEVGQKN